VLVGHIDELVERQAFESRRGLLRRRREAGGDSKKGGAAALSQTENGKPTERDRKKLDATSMHSRSPLSAIPAGDHVSTASSVFLSAEPDAQIRIVDLLMSSVLYDGFV